MTPIIRVLVSTLAAACALHATSIAALVTALTAVAAALCAVSIFFVPSRTLWSTSRTN